MENTLFAEATDISRMQKLERQIEWIASELENQGFHNIVIMHTLVHVALKRSQKEDLHIRTGFRETLIKFMQEYLDSIDTIVKEDISRKKDGNKNS